MGSLMSKAGQTFETQNAGHTQLAVDDPCRGQGNEEKTALLLYIPSRLVARGHIFVLYCVYF